VEARKRGGERRLAGVGAVVAACCALAGVPASASAATIAITTGPDPVESITTQLGVTGTLETSDQHVTLKVKPAGGTGCAANAVADDGDLVIGTDPGIGPYGKTENWTFQQAGSYLLCAWVRDDAQTDEPTIASTSQTVVVRIPHLSLTLGLPAQVLRGRTFQVTATAQTEAQRDVKVALLRDTGRGCPSNWGAAFTATDFGLLLGFSVTGGPTSQTENMVLNQLGRYLACGYVDYGDNVPPEATATGSITVVPPCIVPHLGRGASLRTARARIVAAHCTVGRIRHVRSARHRRGTVIALSPRPGTGHATHAPVAITVSTGPPPHRRHRRR
jgi:hypothetical protein